MPENENDFNKRRYDDNYDDRYDENSKYQKKDEITIKFLIPDVVVGAMLRRDSPVFKKIKKSVSYGPTPAKLMLSDKGVFYPGTNERVIVIAGPPYLVYKACCMFQDQIIDDIFLSKDICGENKAGPRQGQMKIIVSSRSASIVIGKKGVHINDVSKYFNVDIDVHVPTHPDLKNERVITIIGPSMNAFDALEPILYQVSQQSDHINQDYLYYKDIDIPLETNEGSSSNKGKGRWAWQKGRKGRTYWTWVADNI